MPQHSSRGPRRASALLPLLAAALAWPAPAPADRINTGGETGAYHRDFCPVLSSRLARAGHTLACATSDGTRANMDRLMVNPREFAYGQLDAFAMERRSQAQRRNFEIIRADDVRECVFAVSRNPDITTFGELSAYATRLRFTLPPGDSGSAATFAFLRTLDPKGLGAARDVAAAVSVDEAIRAALSTDAGVTLFVQFPDPDNERFRLIRQLGGHLVPIIDRKILEQEIDGRRIYFAQETRIDPGRGATRLTTACTPMIFITGHPDRLRDAADRQRQADIVAYVRALKPDDLMPHDTLFQRTMKRTREVSRESVERLSDLSEQARERAKPFIQRMIERAAPKQ